MVLDASKILIFFSIQGIGMQQQQNKNQSVNFFSVNIKLMTA